jgi:hypothetical protein
MGLSHRGLAELSKRFLKIDARTLENGDLLLFLNKKGDKLKVLGCQGQVVGYVSSLNGSRLMKDALQYLPHTFGATGFDYDGAVKIALEKRLYQGKPQAGPLVVARKAKEAGLASSSA